MSVRVPGRVAWVVPAACASLVGGALLFERYTNSGVVTTPEMLTNAPLALGFSTVGALVVSRRPTQWLGWLYLGTATAMALTLFAFEYAQYGLVTHPGSLPGALAAAWVSAWVWSLGFAPLFTVGLLLYPDSRLPARQWRWVAAVPVIAVLCLALQGALTPGPFVNHPVVHNPVGIDGAAAALRLLAVVGYPMLLFGLASGVAALAVRWRRAPAGGIQRRQISMLLCLAAFVCLTLLTEPFLSRDDSGIAGFLTLLAMSSMSVAVGLAIRATTSTTSTSYSTGLSCTPGLRAGVIALYAASVWGLGHQLGSGTAISAIATGVVAAAVLPLRAALQRLVDRAMYGDRGDPYAAVSRLTTRLQGAAAPGESLAAVADAIAASLRLPYVAVETSDGVQASSGAPNGHPPVEVPLTHQGQHVGRLLVQGRDHRRLSARDEALLTELARPAGAAVHAAGLADALRASRRSLVQAREEERRRLRRDLHDGLGPTLAGVGLGLDVAAGLIERDPAAARNLLEDLKREATEAVDDIRRLVYDLRPPALDELGLVAALRQQADRLTLRDPGLDVRVDAAPDLPCLAAATEVAAYRIVMEAVNNTSRHARASRCDVHLSVADARLQVSVADDGAGFAAGTRFGVGMIAMRERATELGGDCRVKRTPTGTTVVAALPLEAP